MVKICLDSPFPTFNGLHQLFSPLMQLPSVSLPQLGDLSIPIPSFSLILPPLPTLPSPPFGSLKIPSLETAMFAAEAGVVQLMTGILTAIKLVAEKLGLSLLALLPKIPILNINLIDLVTADAKALVAGIKAAIKAAIDKGLDTLAGIFQLPWNYTINIPDIDVLQMLQALIRDYLVRVVNVLIELVKKVIDKFKKILGYIKMIELPKLPTFEEIIKLILSLFQLPDISALIATIRKIPEMIKNIFTALSAIFAPFGVFFTVPDPLMPDLKFPEIEFKQLLLAFFNDVIMGPFKLLMDFILTVLKKILNFQLPVLCFDCPDVTQFAIPVPAPSTTPPGVS